MAILMFAILILIIIWMVADAKKQKEKNDMEKLLGEQVKIKGTTLMVVDYSIVDGTVTLDDGSEMNAELVKKLMDV